MFKVGERVRLVKDAYRGMDVHVPRGETGMVVAACDDSVSLAIKMDNHFECLDEWDNVLYFYSDLYPPPHGGLYDEVMRVGIFTPRERKFIIYALAYLAKMLNSDAQIWAAHRQEILTDLGTVCTEDDDERAVAEAMMELAKKIESDPRF